MTRTLAALAAALIATGARAQTPPPAQPPPSDAPPAAAPAAPAAEPAPAPAAAAATPKKEAAKPKGTFVIGSKAQISINGRAWVELNNVRADRGFDANSKNTKAKSLAPIQNLTRLSSNSSYLRIAGEREVMPGWKAIAQIEAEVGYDGEAGTPFSSTRDTFVGIDTPFGQLIGGKFDSPAKETTIGRDPFGGTGIFGYYNVFSAYRADRRLNNQVMYTSPSIEGATLLASFALGEAKFARTSTDYTYVTDPAYGATTTGTLTKTGTGPRVDPYVASAALHYRAKTPLGPLFAGVAYEFRNDCGAPDAEAAGGPSCDRASLGTDKDPNGTDQVIRFGADYTISRTFTRLAVVYDRVDAKRTAKYGVAAASLSRNAYWGSITQGLLTNKHQLILNYGAAGKYSGTPSDPTKVSYDKTGVQAYTVAYRYNLDDNAMFYVALTQIINERNQNVKFGSGSVPGSEANGWKTAPYGATDTGFGTGFRFLF